MIMEHNVVYVVYVVYQCRYPCFFVVNLLIEYRHTTCRYYVLLVVEILVEID